MTDLFWPGDERAGLIFGERLLLESMLEVEVEWHDALVRAGIAPDDPDGEPLEDLVGLDDLRVSDDQRTIATQSERSGNPVVPLVAMLRERAGDVRSPWLHRGLTSQDVLDTALVLQARLTARDLLVHLDRQVEALIALARRHRDDVMAGRTLTQHAVPITFGLKAAQWLAGLLDARDDVRALRFPVQVGGAAGTLAAVAEIAGDPDAAQFLVADLARHLQLDNGVPWHTNRSAFTRYADALVRATDAMGHVANDVLLLSRAEIAELHEPGGHGRGGSSTMPHKQNPVLSVLVRRAALAGPGLAAQVHLAAASMVDERADGGWHLEWSALATLSRRTLVAASQTAELVEGLRVDTGRMAANVKQHADTLLAERDSLRQLVEDGRHDPARNQPSDYLGAAHEIVDEILERAQEDE